MDATGISEKTIDKSLKELKRLGVIDWSRGKKGKTNSYTILPAAEWDLSERDEWLGQGARAKRAFLDRKRRSTFKRGLAGSGVDLRPGEERPEDEDERKW